MKALVIRSIFISENSATTLSSNSITKTPDARFHEIANPA